MKFAVVGCGSIGLRHIRNLLSLGERDIIAHDNEPRRLAEATTGYGIEGCYSLEETLGSNPDAVIVCTPTSFHVPVALAAAKMDCDLLIEKPLSHTLDRIEELLEQVSLRNLVTLIGCNFKFHPSFLKMKEILESGVLGRILSARCQFGQYLPDWHPWEDYRQGYSARSDLGGGILLDAHEFDYMRWFLGEVDQVFCLCGKLSDLEIDTEDTAEVILKFKSRCIAEMHLDYTQRAYQRDFEFFGENGTLMWEFSDQRVRLFTAQEKKWEVFEQPDHYDVNEMYLEEMKHFIHCVQNRKRAVTDIVSGYETLKVVMAAKASAQEGHLIGLARMVQ